MKRETRRPQRTIEPHTDDGEDLAVAESGVNWRRHLRTRLHHFENTKIWPPSVNVSVGSVAVAMTESLEVVV
jgi:hypothetical protein